MKKLYIIAGEASGDLHASNLMKALLNEEDNLDFRYWGGDKMASVYGKPRKHISELAFMGFIEVVMHLSTILKNISFCKNDILEYQPDALVLVDYPGFNLRIAKWAKKKGIPVIYYISPQIWAWKQSRVHTIKKVVDKMLVILPFEKAFYKRFGMDVTFVGHPLLDEIKEYKRRVEPQNILNKHHLEQKPIIALIPGSRKQEIHTKLPLMLESVEGLSDYQFVVTMAPSLEKKFYQPLLEKHSNVRLIDGGTYDILTVAKAALVTSGTATLETALFGVPEVVCYKGSSISYHIAKRLIKVDFISLVNLIFGKEIVKELIQEECRPKRIREELEKILPGGEKREEMVQNYQELIGKLGREEASLTAAREILKFIR